MPYLLIDPAEKLPHTCDWAAVLDDVGSPSDTISTSTWAVTPQSGSPLQPNLTQETISGTTTSVLMDSGIRTEVYQLTNTMVTALGYTYERSFTIRCENR